MNPCDVGSARCLALVMVLYVAVIVGSIVYLVVAR